MLQAGALGRSGGPCYAEQTACRPACVPRARPPAPSPSPRAGRLSASPNAYVRPSPARGTRGGVARATFDAIILCEAAGYSKVRAVERLGAGV